MKLDVPEHYPIGPSFFNPYHSKTSIVTQRIKIG